MPAPRKTRNDVGAWVLQSNPSGVFDAIQEMADRGLKPGTTFPYEWTLIPSYRVDLILKGDPVIVWMTGTPRRGYTPGVHLIGRVTGDPFEAWGIDDSYLVDDERSRQRVFQVDFRAYRLSAPIPSTELKEVPELKQSEKFTGARSMGNPLLLTPRETVALAAHLPPRALSASGWSRVLTTSKYTQATV